MIPRKLSAESSTALDFIRAITAQLVVIGHGISFCGIISSLQQPNFPWMQNIAVVVFFILSGFLISYSVANRKNGNQYNFYHYFIARFSRIYTAFIPAIIFVTTLDFISINMSPELFQYYSAFNIRTFFGNILMLQDAPGINFITSFGSARPFWTLAVEWWIYMFFGLVVFSFENRKKTQIVDVLWFLPLAIVPVYNFLGGRGNGLTLYWINGALMFIVWNSQILDDISLRGKLVFLISVVVVASFRVMMTMREYDPIFAFALSIVVLLTVDISAHLNFSRYFHSSSRFLSSYSYTLYLIHYSIFDFLTTHFGKSISPYIIFLIGFFASNLLSMLMGRYFEISVTKKVKKKMNSIIRVYN